MSCPIPFSWVLTNHAVSLNLHDARAVMHVGGVNKQFPLKPVAWKNVPDIPGACANHNFTYLVRRPCCRATLFMRDAHNMHWPSLLLQCPSQYPPPLPTQNYYTHKNMVWLNILIKMAHRWLYPYLKGIAQSIFRCILLKNYWCFVIGSN